MDFVRACALEAFSDLGLISFCDRNLFSFGMRMRLDVVLLLIVLRPDWRSDAVVGSIVDVDCFL